MKLQQMLYMMKWACCQPFLGPCPGAEPLMGSTLPPSDSRMKLKLTKFERCCTATLQTTHATNDFTYASSRGRKYKCVNTTVLVRTYLGTTHKFWSILRAVTKMFCLALIEVACRWSPSVITCTVVLQCLISSMCWIKILLFVEVVTHFLEPSEFQKTLVLGLWLSCFQASACHARSLFCASASSVVTCAVASSGVWGTSLLVEMPLASGAVRFFWEISLWRSSSFCSPCCFLTFFFFFALLPELIPTASEVLWSCLHFVASFFSGAKLHPNFEVNPCQLGEAPEVDALCALIWLVNAQTVVPRQSLMFLMNCLFATSVMFLSWSKKSEDFGSISPCLMIPIPSPLSVTTTSELIFFSPSKVDLNENFPLPMLGCARALDQIVLTFLLHARFWTCSSILLMTTMNIASNSTSMSLRLKFSFPRYASPTCTITQSGRGVPSCSIHLISLRASSARFAPANCCTVTWQWFKMKGAALPSKTGVRPFKSCAPSWSTRIQQLVFPVPCGRTWGSQNLRLALSSLALDEKSRASSSSELVSVKIKISNLYIFVNSRRLPSAHRFYFWFGCPSTEQVSCLSSSETVHPVLLVLNTVHQAQGFAHDSQDLTLCNRFSVLVYEKAHWFISPVLSSVPSGSWVTVQKFARTPLLPCRFE